MTWGYQGPLDEHGQPPKVINAKRVDERTVSELIGLVKGIVADKVVSEAEACILRDWLSENYPLMRGNYVATTLIKRINSIFKDGIVDEAERNDLFETLLDVIGGKVSAPHVHSQSTHLPLDIPYPEIKFGKMEFCVTGKFVYGPRKKIVQAIEERGGMFKSTVNRTLNYLVIGAIGSRDWIQSTHGRKIEEAVFLKKKGLKIKIVNEEHFIESVDRNSIF
jgi:NAD-dependent DNA ligase